MLKIVLIDDERRVLIYLKKLIPFDKLGLELAFESTNSKKALEYLQSNHVDIVITDIKMPSIDGLCLLEELFKNPNHPLAIITTAYDNFSYVKKAITLGVENYLLKPINKNELFQTLMTTVEKCQKKDLHNFYDNSYTQFKQNILRRWLYNTIDSYELKERAFHAGLELTHAHYSAIGVYLEEINIPIANFKEKTLNIFTEYTNCKNTIDIVEIDSSCLVLILSYNNSNYYSKRIEELLNNLLNYIQNFLKLCAYIVIGKKVDNYKFLYQSYNSIKDLDGLKRFTPSGTIISYEKNYFKKEKNEYFSKINFFQLDNHIKNHNPDQAFAFVKKIFEDMNSMLIYDESEYSKISLEILMHVALILRNTNSKLAPLPPILDNMFDQYNKTHFQNELFSLLNEIFQETNRYLLSIHNNKSPIIAYVLNYIKNNYSHSSINLTTIAEMASSNPSYLGQLFKNEMNVSFSRYLNKIRISHAKELLETTDMNICDISKSCGYSNQSYFQKVFKKITLQSPLDYRKNYLNEGS